MALAGARAFQAVAALDSRVALCQVVMLHVFAAALGFFTGLGRHLHNRLTNRKRNEAKIGQSRSHAFRFVLELNVELKQDNTKREKVEKEMKENEEKRTR